MSFSHFVSYYFRSSFLPSNTKLDKKKKKSFTALHTNSIHTRSKFLTDYKISFFLLKQKNCILLQFPKITQAFN